MLIRLVQYCIVIDCGGNLQSITFQGGARDHGGGRGMGCSWAQGASEGAREHNEVQGHAEGHRECMGVQVCGGGYIG